MFTVSYWRFKNDAHELIDSHHNISHLILGNQPVTIQVIHAEGPVQLLVQRPMQQGGEGHQHVLRQVERILIYKPEVNFSYSKADGSS